MNNTKVGITLSASDETQAAFSSVNKSLGELAAKNQSLFQGVGGFAGGLVGSLLGVNFAEKIQSAITSTYAFSASLDDMSERTGASVENLSALVGVAKIGGHDLGTMEAGLQKLAKALHTTDDETKGAGKALAAIGLSMEDLSKLDTADAMLKVAQSLAEFENGSAKTAVAIALLGKNGAAMLPFLNDLAEKSSLVGKVTTEQAAMAERYEKNLNKLSSGFGVVGKTIALELLPFMVRLTDEAAKAKDSTGGFAEMLGGGVRNVLETVAVLGVNTAYVFKAIGTELGGIAAQGAALMSGDFKGAAAIGKMMKDDAAQARKEVDDLTARILDRSKAGAAIIAEQKKKLSFQSGNDPKEPKGKKAKGDTPEASPEATAYAKSMEALATMTRDADAAQLDLTKSQKALYDLMVMPEWKNMPDAWKATAVAQFEEARAAEEAADATKRLNDMLGKTESAGIEKARADMELLTKALEDGVISEQKYLEAVKARLEGSARQADAAQNEMDEFAKSAAKNMQSSLADFLFDPFAKGTDGMLEQFGNMLRRMAAEAAAAQISRYLFGDMGATSNGGSGGWGAIGSLIGMVGGFFSGGASTAAAGDLGSGIRFANGGIMTDAGAVPLRKYASGGVANRPQLAMFGDGSTPEAYVPLPDGRAIPVRMQGSGGMTINQTIYAGQGTDSAQVRRSAAAGARAALGAMNGARRYG